MAIRRSNGPAPAHGCAAFKSKRDTLLGREADPDYVLPDGTLAECDRQGGDRAGYFANHRRHGMDVQVVADSEGRRLQRSPALPGRGA